jgi:hypothetical protein
LAFLYLFAKLGLGGGHLRVKNLCVWFSRETIVSGNGISEQKFLYNKIGNRESFVFLNEVLFTVKENSSGGVYLKLVNLLMNSDYFAYFYRQRRSAVYAAAEI